MQEKVSETELLEAEAAQVSYQWVDSQNFSNSFTLVGRHTYVIGEESGRFAGRWNGIWTLPIKVADNVEFAISDGKKTYHLHNYITKFVTKLSRVERTYCVKELNLTISELMFIPEDRQAVCWRFVAEGELTPRELRLLVYCEFNLMWEAKQAGEQYRTKKEILQYDEKDYLVLAKHYRHPDWTGVLGANRQPALIRFGLDRKGTPALGDPDFGSVQLEYEMIVSQDEGSFDIDLCLAGGSLSYQEIIAEFHDCMVSFEDLSIQKAAVYEEYLMSTLEVSLLDESISRAFKWSKVNLRMLEHFQSGFGTGLFAGLPHFAIYFGRDIAWSTNGLLAIGDFHSARENLNLLAKFQARANGEDMLREPFYLGEIPHEIRTEGTVYHYSVDATPLFVMACKRYLDWTKDTDFVRYLYDNIIRAVEWSIRADHDGDGLVEHGPEGFLIDTTWMDSYYRGKSAIDVQAICCRALFDGSQIAIRLGDESRASHWLTRAVKMKNLIIQRYWDSASKFFYDTIGVNGEPKASLTINSIVPVMLGLTDEDITGSVMRRIESSEFTTDWGIRTMSSIDPEYDPRSYQKGGVWPLCTGWVARTEFTKRLYREGHGNIKRFITGLDMGANYFKEVLYGDLPPIGKNPVQPTGCFIQAWSAGMFLSSVVEGLLGVDPGIGQASDVRIAPYLGEQKNSRLEGSNIRVGQSLYDLRVINQDSVVRLKLKNRGPGPRTIESGFVLSTGLTSVASQADSSRLIQGLTYESERGYLTCSFKVKLREDESTEVQLKLS